jgi:hypothetical protein
LIAAGIVEVAIAALEEGVAGADGAAGLCGAAVAGGMGLDTCGAADVGEAGGDGAAGGALMVPVSGVAGGVPISDLGAGEAVVDVARAVVAGAAACEGGEATKLAAVDRGVAPDDVGVPGAAGGGCGAASDVGAGGTVVPVGFARLVASTGGTVPAGGGVTVGPFFSVSPHPARVERTASPTAM